MIAKYQFASMSVLDRTIAAIRRGVESIIPIQVQSEVLYEPIKNKIEIKINFLKKCKVN